MRTFPALSFLLLARWMARIGAIALVAAVVRADLYVSPSGSDAAEGTEARPFASLERARDAVRGLKRDGKLPKAGVWLG